jgi:hypothetical protein
MTIPVALLMLCLQPILAHDESVSTNASLSALYVFIVILCVVGLWVAATIPWYDDRERIMVKIQQRIGPDGQIFLMPVECA